MRRVPVDARQADWPRTIANGINALVAVERQANRFETFASAPATPFDGQTYYDSVLLKVRTWDGTVWQDHW